MDDGALGDSTCKVPLLLLLLLLLLLPRTSSRAVVTLPAAAAAAAAAIFPLSLPPLLSFASTNRLCL
jgi:hypothetical protein